MRQAHHRALDRIVRKRRVGVRNRQVAYGLDGMRGEERRNGQQHRRPATAHEALGALFGREGAAAARHVEERFEMALEDDKRIFHGPGWKI